MEVEVMLVDLGTFMSQSASLLAYIGPGADLGLISSVIGLLLTLGASTFFVLLYPIRTMWRKLRGQNKPLSEDTAEEPVIHKLEKEKKPERMAA
jgi:hypothetical protein